MIITLIRYTPLDLNFASTFVPASLDQVLASSTSFSLQLIQIINRTAASNTYNSAVYSAIWSSSFDVNADELFRRETRYTFFQRTHTNVSVTIKESFFYVSNTQRPSARQTEMILRNLLFTIVILELFGLFSLVIKLMLVPVLHIMHKRLQLLFKKSSDGSRKQFEYGND